MYWNGNTCIGVGHIRMKCNCFRMGCVLNGYLQSQCTCMVKRKHSASTGWTIRMLLTGMETSRSMNLVSLCVFIKQCTIHVWEESLIHIYIRTSLLKKPYSIMSEFIYWTFISTMKKNSHTKFISPPHPSIKLALSGNKST